jgi:hypothetical protein
MKYGFVLPRGDARTAADFAAEAEAAGWDGFFVWEPVWGIDAWVCLAAAAMRTERIRLGTLLTPLSRMRPWKLASETLTLDHLSKGRLTLAVGLGALDTGFEAFGEVTDRKQRAELLDEGLELLTLMWRGRPFRFEGKHYQIDVSPSTFHTPMPPPSIQQPRIPIWVVGAWPSRKSMARALRYDGLLPNVLGEDGKVRMGTATPEELRQMVEYAHEQRRETFAGQTPPPYDIVVEGQTPGSEPERVVEIVRPYAEAGATWWLEAMWETSNPENVLARLRQGPPPQFA